MIGMAHRGGDDAGRPTRSPRSLEIAAAIAIGGAIGLVTARRIQMTAMPQLVAAFHCLVGMAAVLVGAAAFLNPERSASSTPTARSCQVSRVELGLGVAIGAITFSGSVIAFLKLNGNMSRRADPAAGCAMSSTSARWPRSSG